MISLDTTLQTIRKFNADYTHLLAEANDAGFQSMDEFYKEVKQFYAGQGVTVSDKLIKFIVDVYGVEAAKKPDIMQNTKNIMKNPQRFLTNVMKALGVDANAMAQKVNQTGNPQNDPNIAKAIPKFLQLMQSIESHVSGSHSVLDTISTDQYDQLQLFRSTVQRAERSLRKAGVANARTQQAMLAELIRIGNARLTGQKSGGRSGDLFEANKTVKFLYNGQIVEGTVLLDSDTQIDQAYLDGINTNGQIIKEPLDEIQSPALAGHIWVQYQGQVFVVNKATLPKEELSEQMADFIPNMTDEMKSLLQLPSVFFQPISGEVGAGNKSDNKHRRDIAGAVGSSEYAKEKAEAIATKMGFRPTASDEEDEQGEWFSPLRSESMNQPIMLVIQWIHDNYADSGIELSSDGLTVKGGKMSSGVFSSKYFTANFDANSRSRDISKVINMDVRNIAGKEQNLIQFCQTNRISFKDIKTVIRIKNQFN